MFPFVSPLQGNEFGMKEYAMLTLAPATIAIAWIQSSLIITELILRSPYLLAGPPTR